MGEKHTAPELLPGTVDLLILKSSLYPGLQRLLLNGWVKAEWGESENRRRARYDTLTAAGRRHLASEHAEFQQIVAAIQRVLNTT